MAGEDANIGRIMGVRFEDFNNIIKQCRTTDVVGVERQPATPLPGKSVDRKFFNSNLASRSLDYQSSSSSSSSRSNRSAAHSQNSVNSSRNDKYNKSGHNSLSHDGKGKSVSSSQSSKGESGYSRTTGSDRSSLHNSSQKPDQKPESSHDHNKLVSSDHSKSERGQTQAHSSKKESVLQSVKPNRTREPVLQTMKKELIGQAKPENNQSFASNQKSSSSRATAENKDGRQMTDSRTVLKEKEENRNADAKLKNRPKLHIPEVSIPV